MVTRSSMARFALVAVAAAILPAASVAQTPTRPPGGQERAGKIECCTCVDGRVKVAVFSSGAAPGWTVSGPGVSGTISAVPLSLSDWAPLAGAAWVGPANGTSSTAQAGTYIYTIKLVVPRCVIGGRVTLKGRAAADNRVAVKLDGATIASTPGTTMYGFQAANFANFNAPVSPGTHTLTVEVHNQDGYTGMAIQATVETQCPNNPEVNTNT